MRDPNDLQVFKKADRLVHAVYEVTVSFPADERFNLTSQIRRAAVSIPTNLVEGCSRRTQADFARFVEIAYGSAMELTYLLQLAGRLFSLGGVVYAAEQSEEVAKMLNGLGTSLRAET